jgi:hypothetical protein
MNDLPETIELLSARVNALEKRVHDLEQSSVVALAQPAVEAAGPTTLTPEADLASGEQVSGAFLLLGKSMLGIAGAYVLRSLAGSNLLPRPLIAALAIAYAIAWLVAASRTKATERFAGALYAATSALILAPMLWELTMRFGVLTPDVSAAVLGVFAAAATALSWKLENSPVLSISHGAAALTALGLSIVTHVMIPFLVLLLIMLATCEYQGIRTGRRGVRTLVAAVTDVAVWILIFLYRTPESTRTDYPALGVAALVAPAGLLFLITVAAVVFKTTVLERRITALEAIQSMVTFLLSACAALFLVPQLGGRIVGIVCLVFAGVCYAGAFAFFRRRPELRNFHVFALWSAGLLLAGIYLSLPPGWAMVCLVAAAIASALIAVRLCCITLECHGILYLTVAAVGCGLLSYSFQALAGSVPVKVGWSIFLVAGCALLCYIAARERERESWQSQILHLIPALLAVCAAAALTTHGLLWLMALRITPDVFHVALIRTLIVCAIALLLAFAGSRWRRPEMTRIAYAALAFVAAKLLFEDLRHGHMEFIAGSIFLFAMTLIGVPRLARMGHRT